MQRREFLKTATAGLAAVGGAVLVRLAGKEEVEAAGGESLELASRDVDQLAPIAAEKGKTEDLPYGIDYWIVKTNNLGEPYIERREGWKSSTTTYTTIPKAELLQKLRDGYAKHKFRPPVKYDGIIYWDRDVSKFRNCEIRWNTTI